MARTVGLIFPIKKEENKKVKKELPKEKEVKKTK